MTDVRDTTWAVSPWRRRPGELLTRGDVCHLHVDRAAAERCGVLLGGTPDLVQLENQSERVYRVLWSLSDASAGELRRVVLRPPPTPFNAPRMTEHRDESAKEADCAATRGALNGRRVP